MCNVVFFGRNISVIFPSDNSGIKQVGDRSTGPLEEALSFLLRLKACVAEQWDKLFIEPSMENVIFHPCFLAISVGKGEVV